MAVFWPDHFVWDQEKSGAKPEFADGGYAPIAHQTFDLSVEGADIAFGTNPQHDVSWELGTFAGGSERGDTQDKSINIECHHCDLRAELVWHSDDGGVTYHFGTRTIGQASTLNSDNLWSQCETAGSAMRCGFNQGVCYVSERRLHGYVIHVQMGCQMAHACYMQKMQNFLVEHGRQCWPHDNAGDSRLVSTKFSDVEANNRLNTIIGGGVAEKAAGGDFHATNSQLATDFYRSTGTFATDHAGVGYYNGYVETSRCHQCCNTADSCNASWQPDTVADWDESFMLGGTAGR